MHHGLRASPAFIAYLIEPLGSNNLLFTSKRGIKVQLTPALLIKSADKMPSLPDTGSFQKRPVYSQKTIALTFSQLFYSICLLFTFSLLSE